MMLDENEILENIAAGETQTVEFKEKLDNLERFAGEVVAFANSDGGTLYVGIDDDGYPVGLPDSEQAFQIITNICRDRCIPPISPVIEQCTLLDQDIIVLTIRSDLNRQKPYRTAGGRFYIRAGKDKKDATGRELMRIAQASGELHYDESPVLGAGLDAMNLDALDAYHQTQFGISLDEQLEQSQLDLTKLLRNLRLLYDLDGEPTLTVAGLLLFGNTPQQLLPQSRLSAVAFAGTDENSHILDRRTLNGRLPEIIEEARIFVDRHTPRPAIEHGFSREDIQLYDQQIRLFLFKDRIEVRSPGRLPNSVTLENVKLGVHAERNRSIATLLTQLGHMSAIGTGIPRLIIRLSQMVSGRQPEFELVGEELRVRIWARVFP